MRRIAWVAWLLLGACDDAKTPAGPPPPMPIPHAPAPVRAPAPVDASVAAPPEPVDAGPAWTAWDSTPDPSADQLAGPFNLYIGATNGRSMYSGSFTVEGDAKGATVTHIAHSRYEPGEYFKGTLSAEQTRVLLEAVKKFRFWALVDGRAMIQDATNQTVSVTLGSVKHNYQAFGGCPCSRRRPTDSTACECPQLELVALIKGTQANATAAKGVPTKVLTFKPAPTSTIKTAGTCQGTEKVGYTCRTTTNVSDPKQRHPLGMTRVLPWCRHEAKAFACFVSPFDHVQYLVTSSSEAAAYGAMKFVPWAVVLKSGEHCVDEAGDGKWKCDKLTALEAVLPSGENWVGLDKDDVVIPVAGIYLR